METRINCTKSPARCQIEIGGQIFTMGMPKNRAFELLAKTLYEFSENVRWSDEHKPLSLWNLTIPKDQPHGGALRAGVKFNGDKLDAL
jgi:hypothetical protein